MPNENLINYVKEARSARVPDFMIKDKLIAAGWKAADVEEALGKPVAGVQKNIAYDSILNEGTATKSNKKAVILILTGLLFILALGTAAYAFYPPTPEKVVERMFAKLSDVKTMEYSGIVEAKVTTSADLLSLFNPAKWSEVQRSTAGRIAGSQEVPVKIQFEGASDLSNLNTPKSALSMSLSVSGFLFTLDTRTFGDVIYLKLAEFPNLGFDVSKFLNKWIKVDEQAFKAYGFKTSDKGDENIDKQLSPEEEERIGSAVEDYPIFQIANKLADEAINGKKTYHYELSVSKENLANLISQVNEVMGRQMKEEELSSFKQTLKDLTFNPAEIWIGKKDYWPYRLLLGLEFKPANSQSAGTMTFDLTFKNFNQAISIEEPTNATTFTALLDELGITSALIKSKDAQRVSGVNQIVVALELFYNDFGYYPYSKDGKPNNEKFNPYLNPWPQAPTKADGNCTEAGNKYFYTWLNPNDYTLTFCLGEGVSEYRAGLNTIRSP